MQRLGVVQGTITSRDVLLHSFTILRLWGPGFYVRCIRAIASRKSCTFLDVLAADREGPLHDPLIARCPDRAAVP